MESGNELCVLGDGGNGEWERREVDCNLNFREGAGGSRTHCQVSIKGWGSAADHFLAAFLGAAFLAAFLAGFLAAFLGAAFLAAFLATFLGALLGAAFLAAVALARGIVNEF